MHRNVLVRGLFPLASLLLVSLLSIGTPLFAQNEEPTGNSPGEPAIVQIGPQMVTILRAPVYGHTASDRARMAEDRIREAMRDKRVSDFSTVVQSEGTLIYYGQHHLIAILHEDLDVPVGETMEQKVELALSALRETFDRHHRGREPAVIARAAVRALLFTLCYVGLMLGLVWASSSIDGKLRERLARGEVPRLLLLEASVIGRRLVVSLVSVALALAWLTLVLKSFPQTETAGSNLAESFLSALSGLFSGAVGSAPNLLIAILIGALALSAMRCIDVVLRAIRLGKIKFSRIDRDVARPTATLLRVIVVLVALMAAYPFLPGTSSEAFKGIGLIAGVIVSLGSATLFGQISAGFVLMYSGAFKKGDWVIVADGTEGQLLEIGYLTTRMQTFREEVYIPNMVLLGQSARNLSRSSDTDAAPLVARVSIGYDTPWRQVYRLLVVAARDTLDVLAEPPPVVHQVELGDFYVTYELTVYIPRSTGRRIVRSRLFENIQDSFNDAEVQIMSPHFESNPAQKVVAPRSENESKSED